ncbi:MAG: hypothetical protein R3D52_05040 [Xanthobacteraceae bacterium]
MQLDEDGTFPSRCNMAMVELEPVPDEEDINARFMAMPATSTGMAGSGDERYEPLRRASLYLFIVHARFAGSRRAAHP